MYIQMGKKIHRKMCLNAYANCMRMLKPTSRHSHLGQTLLSCPKVLKGRSCPDQTVQTDLNMCLATSKHDGLRHVFMLLTLEVNKLSQLFYVIYFSIYALLQDRV